MAIIVALSLTAILIFVAMVVDFGLIRVDRQVDKSAADAATVAGLHALDIGDGKPHPYVGVCNAVRYLQQNNKRFSNIDESVGWANGLGAPVLNGCSDTTLRNTVCDGSTPATWAKYTWDAPDGSVRVTIQSAYVLGGASGFPTFSEDKSAAATADPGGSTFGGCDQLAVTVRQARNPGLGSLATSSDLVTTVRSVGRVENGPGGYAPAMLLLRRSGCPALDLTAGGSGAGSYVHVFGKRNPTNGLSQPGTIHSDSSGCTSGHLYEGKATDGIVAYAAPTATGVADTAKPGSITSYAGLATSSLSNIRDDALNVYASAALDEAGAGSSAKNAPTGLPVVTRAPVDARYLDNGVKKIMTSAESAVFTQTVTAGTAAAKGYKYVKCSGGAGGGTVGTLPPLLPADRLWVDCPILKGIPTINAGTVVFTGDVSAPALSMPQASEVYIQGSGGDAITLSGTNTFSMHTTGHMAGAFCNPSQVRGRAKLVIRNGSIKQGGGTLQLCNTSVIMMSGQADGCVNAPPPSPNSAPCSSTKGNGQLKQTGGTVDWTPPDEWDTMSLADGSPDPARAPDWKNQAGPEDLALWTESASDSSSTKASLGGGATLRVRGVFMTPNFAPLTIGGTSLLDLTNAQFIASNISLNGGTQIKMSVDPNSAVTLPHLAVVGLVR